MITLGIETSCDETAAAICESGRILSSIVSSQEIHRHYGGVVPELASREHENRLNRIVAQALKRSGRSLSDLTGIAVTQGPGLAGTLLTGICFAKGLALALSLPVIGINHLEAHIFANFLADPTLDFPFICLLVSGGHTQLWQVEALGRYRLLGDTRDDAAGEAFDKGARILGLPYPGGPALAELARDGNEQAVRFPRSFLDSSRLEFSFSGLKTALLYYLDDLKQAAAPLARKDIAASYQAAITDVLITKLAQAVHQTGIRSCVIAGGVAANQRLRELVPVRLPGDTRIIYPPLSLCTDNAAMIAFLGERYLRRGRTSPPDFPVVPNLRLGTA